MLSLGGEGRGSAEPGRGWRGSAEPGRGGEREC